MMAFIEKIRTRFGISSVSAAAADVQKASSPADASGPVDASSSAEASSSVDASDPVNASGSVEASGLVDASASSGTSDAKKASDTSEASGTKKASAARKMHGIRRRIMPYMPFILAFLLPVIILLGIYVGKGIYPFGDSTFLKLDMYHQYAPFLRSFARKLRGDESLLFAWDIGMGTNYVPLYAYYLASPFYWISGLIPDSLVLDFMSYLTVLKIGLCGLTMSIYLSKKYRTRSYAITIFGLSYALCGYIAAYSWCLMWLDVLVFTPLVFYGLERLEKDGRPFL
ncbi:MAG: YfhO family protein, partial [Lachnospiraceae bacterium]|nr:YfhO family protein [Lachnospiraceae bacterium]